MRNSNGLAARAGRWSAQHRFKAIAGWLAFVIAATAIGGTLGTRTLEGAEYGVGESKQADLALERAFPATSGETVLVQSSSGDPDPKALRRATQQTSSALRRTEGVRAVQDPYENGGERAPVSPDGRSALVHFKLDGAGAEDPEWTEIVESPLRTVADLDASHPGFSIEQFGDASAEKALGKVFEDDFRKAEVTSLPITLIVLVIAFGALAAAFVPLLLAITAVAGAIGMIAIFSQLWPVDEAVGSVVLLIGLAVGVDYSMFYLRREREERARGLGPEAALEAAAATSGRAVLVSGVTVMIAMAGMYLSGASTFTSFATGTILVVGMAVVGSLTVLPAVLSKLGDRVNAGRIPFLRRPEQRAGSEPRLWGAIVDRVMRRPLLWGGLAAGVLIAMSIPTLGLKTAVPGIDSLPQDVPAVQTYNKIDAAFPGNEIPATVVVEAGDADTGETRAAIGELRAKTAADSLYGGPASVEASPDGSVVRVDVPLTGNGTDERSERGLERLREEILPATVGGVEGAEANVTGFTAGSVDFNRVMSDRVPLVFVFVLGMAFLLLLLTFRSIVIPIKAIALNLLSVGAAYGLVVWIFQQGHLESVLGFSSSGAVASWLPMFLFVVLFGLSMDYHVFILSRIREAVERGMNSEEAVGHGIKSTAGVVTAAAVVMVAVFSIFATLSALEFKQFGVGLGAAILIDATIVRGLLLPASMKLLGDWNWYLPKWLEWLPRIGREPEPPGLAPQPEPAPEAPTPERRPEPVEA